MVDLPSELIPEILLRSRVKTLLRWKCVCKSWRSLISDHNFATSHYELACSHLQRLVFLEDNAYQTLSIDFNASLIDLSAFNSLRIDFINPSCNDFPVFNSLRLDFLSSKSYPKIGGSCRGFLLLHSCSYSNGGFYLWNPSTCVHKALPHSPKYYDKYRYPCYIKYLYGFTYDSLVDDYFVVLVSDSHRISSLIDVEIFSLKTNEWKKIERDSHLPYTIISSNEEHPSRIASILNGTMHWFIHNHDTSSNVIIAFDLKETRISVIALPDELYTNYFTTDYGVLVSGGQLKTWTVEKCIVKIWVMKEYAVDSSWTQTLVFSMNLIPKGYFSILSFTNCGDIVGAYCMGELVIKINDKGQLLEQYSYHDPGAHLRKSRLAVYTESLLSLSDGTDQTLEDD